MGELQIFIRQTPQVDVLNNPVYYAGSNPLSLTRTTGTLPTGRQWRNYNNFIDISSEVANLQQLELTWTQDRDPSGTSVPGAFQAKKSASGTLLIEGEAFTLIKQWLLDDVSSALNAVDVKFYDKGCNVWYEDYQLKATDLTYCESAICEFSVVVKQRDEQLNCLRSTLIYDNWQGWFPQDGKPVNKKHPRFAYCNEQRPVGTLVLLWKLAAWTFVLTNTVLIPIIYIIKFIIGIINVIIDAINFFGADIDKISQPSVDAIIDGQERSFIDAAGCNREHPAPLIRDYISNVCDKCGIRYDANSIPIFFSQTLTLETSTGLESFSNDYYNACYWQNDNQRGIRRLDGASFFDYLRKPDYNDDEYWIPDNAPVYTLDVFLDKIKAVFNAEWRVYDGKLYFNRKDFFIDDQYVYDFSEHSPDRSKIIEGICYEYDTVKVPASLKGLYDTDAADTCGNEARKQYNSTVSFGDATKNPIIDGLLDKTTQFSAAKFRCDGASADYLYDTCQQCVNGSFFINLFGVFRNVMDELNKTYQYALLLKDYNATLPKIIIWDGNDYNSAAAVRYYHAGTDAFTAASGSAPPMPIPNPPYNNYPTVQSWQQIHPPLTFVSGSNTIPQDYPEGYYTIRSFVGNIISQQPAMLVNYPMYFASEFKGGLWDRFHWIDDPNRSPNLRQMWTVKIPLCCEDIQRLGVKNAAQDIKLGHKVKLNRPFYPDGRIKEITLSHPPDQELGAYIQIKGE